MLLLSAAQQPNPEPKGRYSFEVRNVIKKKVNCNQLVIYEAIDQSSGVPLSEVAHKGWEQEAS